MYKINNASFSILKSIKHIVESPFFLHIAHIILNSKLILLQCPHIQSPSFTLIYLFTSSKNIHFYFFFLLSDLRYLKYLNSIFLLFLFLLLLLSVIDESVNTLFATSPLFAKLLYKGLWPGVLEDVLGYESNFELFKSYFLYF